MTKSVIQTTLTKPVLAIATAMLFATGLSACGEKHEAVTAPDKVDEAAEMARANAPEAEVVEFETTAAPAATTEGADTAMAEGDMATEAAAQPDTTEITADADAAPADGTVPVVKEGDPTLDETATDTTKVE
jgi:hypothetical protein